jgi:hypothetical protein
LRFDRKHLARGLAATGLLVGALIGGAAPAAAQSGGAPAPVPPSTPPSSGVPGVATLQADGSAIAPSDAPRPVRKAINAANRIRFKPYIYGGGHRKFNAKGYDCSGAVSYVLHAAGQLKTPMPSGSFMRWGAPGLGSWISVYANRGHMYAVIAGLRWDTSAIGESATSGSGPRWRSTQRDPSGYVARYAPGL